MGVLVGLTWAVTASGAADLLATCRNIPEDANRLACYDTLTEFPAPLSSVAAAAAETAARVPAAPAREATPPPSPADLFGRDAVQSEDIVRRAAGIDRIEEIRARVAGLRPDPYGKLILTLDNGQVWVQVDSTALNLNSGDDVRIRRASMGSYLLTEVEGKRSSRVRRSR